MIRDHSHRENRSAFTLVELMVVILIIAILVSLLAAAVMKVMGKIPEVQTSSEIAEISVAMQAFMMDYNLSNPPPSTLVLNENVSLYLPSDPNFKFLQQMFGKNLIGSGAPTFWVDWNGDGVQNGPWLLQGQQCLVFYLGGIPNTAAVVGGMPPAPQGFSINNMNPALITPGVRTKGPYFPFVTGRLKPVVGGFGFTYLDPWQVKPSANGGIGPMPYVYFSSSGNNNGYNYMDCSAVGWTDVLGTHFALPYWTGVTAAGLPSAFTNSNGYQLISAGRDGMFGYTPLLPPPLGAMNSNLWSPMSGAVGTGADDQTNFSSTLLGAGQN